MLLVCVFLLLLFIVVLFLFLFIFCFLLLYHFSFFVSVFICGVLVSGWSRLMSLFFVDECWWTLMKIRWASDESRASLVTPSLVNPDCCLEKPSPGAPDDTGSILSPPPQLLPHQNAVLHRLQPEGELQRLFLDPPTEAGKTGTVLALLDRHVLNLVAKFVILPTPAVARSVYM